MNFNEFQRISTNFDEFQRISMNLNERVVKRNDYHCSGEKPYACNICGTAYAARDTYVQHYKRKHTAKPEGAAEPRPR